jgi:hypothetical protein
MAEPTTTTTATLRSPPADDFNAWADYWRYEAGLNTIPAHTLVKKTFISWKEWQTKPVPDGLHEQWKRENKFADGLAIIPGKVWRGEHAGKYLIFVDCDNLKAIEEFFTRNGKTVSLRDVAEKFIVEQHKDNPNKAHIYFYSEIPFVGKSSDTNKVGTEKIASDEVPAFEIKGMGTHGIAYCTPSVHKNGEHYRIIGTLRPETLDANTAHEMMQHLDSICKRYGLQYLENTHHGGNGKALPSIADLFKEDYVVKEGHNRHEALLRIMESLMVRLRSVMTHSEIEEIAHKWNKNHCRPPLDDIEFEKQWKYAITYIEKKKDGEQEQEEQQKPEANDEEEEHGKEKMLPGCMIMELINRSPETYVVVVKNDHYYNETTASTSAMRAIQQVQVEWDPDEHRRKYKFKHIILNAIPVEPIQVIGDPLFEQTKYKMAFEYVGPDNEVKRTDGPIGPFTKEELKEYLLKQTQWVYKERLLGDALNQVINGFSRKSGMAIFKNEIETEGLIWLNDNNKKLVLSKLNDERQHSMNPTPEEARQCTNIIHKLQEQFYPSYKPLERKRLAHFIKIGIVAPIDFARRQNGAVESFGIIPRQDLGGWSKTGKTYGYAGIILRMYRLPYHGKKKYVIGSGSIETEARLIDQSKWTTMPVIFDDADFLTDWQRNDQAKRCLSLIKYASDMTNPRDILTSDSKRRNLPFCAYPMFTHNSELIDEDGFIRRSIGHEFTKEDEKSDEQIAQYDAFFKLHGHTFGFLGDFVIWYYLEHPDILFNDWLTIAKTILRAFYEYAGVPEEAIPQWLLEEVVKSATSQTGLAEARASNIAAALHDIIQNQGWVKNKREAAIWISQNLRNKLLAGEFDYETPAARKTIDEVMANATLEEKIRALIALDTLPHFKWHHDREVCIMSSIVEELRRRGISRVSHKQIASYCNGFTYEKIWLGSKQFRVIHSKLEDFVRFTNPGQHHHISIQAAMQQQ